MARAKIVRPPGSKYVHPKCPHGRRQYRCVPCKGAGICEHNRRRTRCIQCNGAGICEHKRVRYDCIECDGAGICEHKRIRKQCIQCDGSSICEHKRERYYCIECDGAGICEHKRVRSRCIPCNGSSICEHRRRRTECIECNGSGICEHKRHRNYCADCDGSQICEHKRQRNYCADCDGSQICEHGHQRQACAICCERCEHGRLKRRCKGKYCEAGKLKGTSIPELHHLAVLWIVYELDDDLQLFLDHTIRAKFYEEDTRINVDAEFNTVMGRLFVEYDGWWYHKDKLERDEEKTRVLCRYGRVLRIRDALAPIVVDNCDNVIVDSKKDKDGAYRKTYDFIGGPEASWPTVWNRAKSLATRAIEFLMDKSIQTMDDFVEKESKKENRG